MTLICNKGEHTNESSIPVIVELFGMARIASGRLTVELNSQPETAVKQVVNALAKQCPELVGIAISEDRLTLLDSYKFNLNGTEFLSGNPPRLRSGDRLLLFSSQAGG